MRYLSVTSVLLLLVVFVTRCSEEAAPTAFLIDSSIENPALSKTVVHHVSVGGADICEALGLPTGCDANFSLVANEMANGSVSGQWQDTFRINGQGVPVHVTIDCINVVGKEAWVSGVITGGPSLVCSQSQGLRTMANLRTIHWIRSVSSPRTYSAAAKPNRTFLLLT